MDKPYLSSVASPARRSPLPKRCRKGGDSGDPLDRRASAVIKEITEANQLGSTVSSTPMPRFSNQSFVFKFGRLSAVVVSSPVKIGCTHQLREHHLKTWNAESSKSRLTSDEHRERANTVLETLDVRPRPTSGDGSKVDIMGVSPEGEEGEDLPSPRRRPTLPQKPSLPGDEPAVRVFGNAFRSTQSLQNRVFQSTTGAKSACP